MFRGGRLADVKTSLIFGEVLSIRYTYIQYFQDIDVMLNFLPEKIGWEAVCRVSCRPSEVPYTTGFWIVMLVLRIRP